MGAGVAVAAGAGGQGDDPEEEGEESGEIKQARLHIWRGIVRAPPSFSNQAVPKEDFSLLRLLVAWDTHKVL